MASVLTGSMAIRTLLPAVDLAMFLRALTDLSHACLAPVQRMRRIPVGIHAACVGEDHFAAALFRRMNRVDDVPLPLLGIRIGSNDVASAMDVIEDDIVGLQLRLHLSNFRVGHLPAQPRGGCCLACSPATVTHGLEHVA